MLDDGDRHRGSLYHPCDTDPSNTPLRASIPRAPIQGIAYTVFLAGFSSLSFCLVVLLAYQSAYGYVYERIGLLTAAYMAGSAAGAYLARNADSPVRLTRASEAPAAVLLLLAPLFFRHEALYLALTVLVGVAGGAVFVSAVMRTGEADATGRAGRLFALDLAGSFLGALLTALFLIPLFGVRNVLFGMVLVKILSLIVLGTVRKNKRRIMLALVAVLSLGAGLLLSSQSVKRPGG